MQLSIPRPDRLAKASMGPAHLAEEGALVGVNVCRIPFYLKMTLQHDRTCVCAC